MTERSVQVRINGSPREVEEGLDVRGLLESLELVPELVVVEHNREILRREDYASVSVRAGDVLELVHFVGGG